MSVPHELAARFVVKPYLIPTAYPETLPMSASPEKLDDWLDKESVTEDDITAFPLTAMAATLEREERGGR